MANRKISQLTPFSGNVQNDDLFEVVDVSDTSMAPTGTNKKVTWQSMKVRFKRYLFAFKWGERANDRGFRYFESFAG